MVIFFGQVSGKVSLISSPLVRVHSSSPTSVSALGNRKGQFMSWLRPPNPARYSSFMLLFYNSTRVSNRGSISADIIKMIESQPELACQIRRIRGGYLKIQGTWIPYEVRAHSIHIVCTRLTLTFTVRTSTVSSVCWALMYLRTATCFDCTHDSVAFAIRFDLVPLFGCVLSLIVSNST